MNPNPLSMRSRAIVPVGIPKPSVRLNCHPALMSWKIVGQSRQDGRVKSRKPGRFSGSLFGGRFGGFGCGLGFRRRVGRPEMAAAVRAYPELVGRPRPVGGGVSHFHLGSAPHAPDLKVGHSRILSGFGRWAAGVRYLKPEA